MSVLFNFRSNLVIENITILFLVKVLVVAGWSHIYENIYEVYCFIESTTIV